MALIGPKFLTAAARQGREMAWMLAQAGWPAVLGVGLLVFAAAFHGAALMPARERLAELRTEVASQRLLATRRKAERGDTGRMAALPPESARESILLRVHDAAGARGVGIATAEYRQSRDGRLLKSEFILPVHGAYPQLRDWLADIMNGNPSLALDEFSLHRESVGNPELEGRVRLSLFLEPRR